jgi:tetratricopeptide (TPR) repeat protein
MRKFTIKPLPTCRVSHRLVIAMLSWTVVLVPGPAFTQKTVFDLAKSHEKRGDQLFNTGVYFEAISAYKKAAGRGATSNAAAIRIARCYYYLHDYTSAVHWFREYIGRGRSLSREDKLLYAESLAAVNEYEPALEVYRALIKEHPDDELIGRKIWRLSNVRFLFEDSLQYAIQPLSVNTPYDESVARATEGGIVFASNRRKDTVVEHIDAATGAPFYTLYYVNAPGRPGEASGLNTPHPFSRTLVPRRHSGPVAFYNRGTSMIYTATASTSDKTGRYHLELRNARFSEGKWIDDGPLPFNNREYSLTDPWINEQGTVLYFSSDMPGGFGGKDLYRSLKDDKGWSRPLNLGENVNTRLDECHPSVYDGTLYFASNGQPGLGGLDVFRIDEASLDDGEVINMGFPVNSHADDYSFVLLNDGYRGYLTSARNGNDDLFEVEMNQQTYPLMIRGRIQEKEYSWMEGADLKTVVRASLFLVDQVRGQIVAEAHCDDEGIFELTVPYFSVYRIRVVQQDGSEAVVSLEIPRQKKEDYHHEIVIVRDAFRKE